MRSVPDGHFDDLDRQIAGCASTERSDRFDTSRCRGVSVNVNIAPT